MTPSRVRAASIGSMVAMVMTRSTVVPGTISSLVVPVRTLLTSGRRGAVSTSI